MTTLIESAVSLADVARVTKSPVAQVESDCRSLSLFVGADWAGKPAISVRDAHALVSGVARRDHEHAAAHLHWRTAVEAWQAEGKSVRRVAYGDRFDAARRRGVGDPQAAHEAAQAASAATVAFERKTPQPSFDGAETPRLSMRKRFQEVVQR